MNTAKEHIDLAKLKSIVVLGAGESGVGAALLADAKGYEVLVSEYGKVKDKFRNELTANSIEFEEGGHDMDRVLNADVIIKSPGIPEKAPVMKEIRAKGLPVISEIEWASRFTDGTIVAITGSNGKTTTTSWIHHILHNAGMDVALAGNIGKSLARTVFERSYEYYVVEVSSFQLDDIDTFKPHVSVITNITEDHLDRYNYRFEEYIASKLKIASNQDASDYCIYCFDDPVTAKYAGELKNTVCIPFSLDHTLPEGASRQGDEIIFHLKKNDLPCQ